MPPVGINNRVNPIVSVNTIDFKIVLFPKYFLCKLVVIQAATPSDTITPTLKNKGDCGPSKKKKEVNTSEIHRYKNNRFTLLEGLLLMNR